MTLLLHTPCCDVFGYWLQEHPERAQFHYSPAVRSYLLTAPKCKLRKGQKWPVYTLVFCPHCGSQFPHDLKRVRKKILKREYGVDTPDDPLMQKHIPQEFFSDEWWKKRGL